MRYWEPLADEEVQRIHESGCRILAELGMRIRNERAIQVLVGAGARRIGRDMVCFPRDLVERSIASAPQRFTMYDRRGGTLEIGSDTHYHVIGATMTDVVDYPNWARRPATLADVRNLTRLVDALDAVDIAAVAVEGQDVAPDLREILSCAEVLKNSSKVVLACPVRARANEVFVAMTKAMTGMQDLSKRPPIGLLATMVPGYEIDYEAAEVLMLAGREGLPVILMGGGIMGAQSPATMAGTVVMQTAEELAGLCLVQAVRPGSPCLLNWGCMKLDMRSMEAEFAGPEFHIAMGVGAQLSRKYGIPSYTCPGADSKVGDLQAGFEFTDGMYASLLSGIHVTVNAGTAAGCSAASYELLMLHNEMLRSMKRVRQGMVVTEETCAVDVQLETGFRGDYLAHPQTLKYIRNPQEFMHKDLFDSSGPRGEYQDALLRAQMRCKQILATHQPAVSAEERKAVDDVVERFIR